jgi:hypothetical protein
MYLSVGLHGEHLVANGPLLGWHEGKREKDSMSARWNDH